MSYYLLKPRDHFKIKMSLSKAFCVISKFSPYMSHEKSIRESGVIMGWIYVYIWHASKIGQKIYLRFSTVSTEDFELTMTSDWSEFSSDPSSPPGFFFR